MHPRSAMASVQTQVCETCGDVGFADCLAVCSRCKEGAEHVYCMATIPVATVPPDWVCDGCEPRRKTALCGFRPSERALSNVPCTLNLKVSGSPRCKSSEEPVFEFSESKISERKPNRYGGVSSLYDCKVAAEENDRNPELGQVITSETFSVSELNDPSFLNKERRLQNYTCPITIHRVPASDSMAEPKDQGDESTGIITSGTSTNTEVTARQIPEKVCCETGSIRQDIVLLDAYPRDSGITQIVVNYTDEADGKKRSPPAGSNVTTEIVGCIRVSGSVDAVVSGRSSKTKTPTGLHASQEPGTARVKELAGASQDFHLKRATATTASATDCISYSLNASESFEVTKHGRELCLETIYTNGIETASEQQQHICNGVEDIIARERDARDSRDNTSCTLHSFDEQNRARHHSLAAYIAKQLCLQTCSASLPDRAVYSERFAGVTEPEGTIIGDDVSTTKKDILSGGVLCRKCNKLGHLEKMCRTERTGIYALQSHPLSSSGRNSHGVIVPESHSWTTDRETGLLVLHAVPMRLWSGRFLVHWTDSKTCYGGLQAHPPNLAHPKVLETMKTLPATLQLQAFKRGEATHTWPRTFQQHPPTSNRIGVYFFPAGMNSRLSDASWYRRLVDRVSSQDLVLRLKVDVAQLLIFPSCLLPEEEQCSGSKHFLWGVFEENRQGIGENMASPQPTEGIGENMASPQPTDGRQ